MKPVMGTNENTGLEELRDYSLRTDTERKTHEQRIAPFQHKEKTG